MQLTDTHCHIHSQDYSLEPEVVLKRARLHGVRRIICVGTDADDSKRASDFANTHENCYASVGLHPHDAKLGEGPLESIAKLAKQPKVVAIGECGLDYYYTHSPKDQQKTALIYQIELAIEHKLPLIFHVREAFDDFWEIVDKYEGLTGVIHSFTAGQVELEQIIKRGFYVGLNGIITFSKDESQLDAAKAVPLDKLVLETDAPFLTPVPHRGTINEPGRIGLISVFLANLRGEDQEALAAVTTANAERLFDFK